MNYKIICVFFTLILGSKVLSQENETSPRHEFRFSGQLSGWGQFAPDINTKFWLGGRYIPQFNYGLHLPKEQLLDFEVSANLFGDIGIPSFKEVEVEGKIKPYRAWARYSNKRLEARLGLQKINFGSAQMFRPLMWFDTMDPRDPLQLTDGVWAGLFRYYFQNNANVWFWTLYGNDQNKGWEIVPASQSFPELGGRLQLPLKQGEVALSYHFRKADYQEYLELMAINEIGYVNNVYSNQNYLDQMMRYEITGYDKIPESRVGFDVRLDRVIGIWLEGSWTHLNKDAGEFTNQEMFTLGGDYTFGIGNGLALTFEQLLYSYDKKAFAFDNTITFSGLMITYPVTLFDDVNVLVYFDWKNNNFYSFLNWKHQLNNIALHAMFYWNPENITMPGQMGSNRFYGKGIQFMVVWNH